MYRNTFFRIIMFYMILCIPLSLKAYDAQIDGIYYNLIGGKVKTAEVTYKMQGITSPQSDYTGEIIIPDTVEYEGVIYSVNKIGDYAFNNCDISSITIPKTINVIGAFAFRDCSHLNAVYISDLSAWSKMSSSNYGPLRYAHHLFLNGSEIINLVIPDDVTTIGNNAFSGGTEFMSISIPNSVNCIGDQAFDGCVSIDSIIIPNSVTQIGYGAFSNCTNLQNISVGESVISIGKETFKNCSNLTEISIPNSLTTIPESAFLQCIKLNSATIGEGVVTIEKNAFNHCSSLFNLSIGGNVKNIAESAFAYCTSLTSIVIPNNVKDIGYAVFYGCNNLNSVFIGDDVETIGKQAFDGCTNLSSITIGKNLRSVGDYAFQGCRNLSEVHISNLEGWCNISSFQYENNPLSFAHHLYIDEEEVYELIIPETVSTINKYVFSGCKYLSSVTIHNSIERINNNAFYGCEGLNAVKIEDVRAWCEITFTYTSNPLLYAHHLYLNNVEIKDLVLPNDMTYIKDYAFSGCSGLTSVKINKRMKSFGSYCFSDCSNLVSVTIPDSVRYIYSNAFRGCSKLKTLKILSGETVINSQAFSKCLDLEDVFCYSEIVPTAANDIFNDSYISYATLHVPEVAIDSYKSKSPWNQFGTIVGFNPYIDQFDVNKDGEVNIADINAVIDMILSGDSNENGDTNKDGEVNIADINAVIDMILSN